jgi:hypothetical protein
LLRGRKKTRDYYHVRALHAAVFRVRREPGISISEGSSANRRPNLVTSNAVSLDENVPGTYNSRFLPETVSLERPQCRQALPIHPIHPAPSCFPKPETRNLNHLVLIPFRRARERLRQGQLWQPKGPPPRHPQSQRRVPDLVARPLSPQALSKLLDRKPYLLRPLAVQLLPPPLAPIDPAERLEIDLSAIHTAEDLRQLPSHAARLRPPRAHASLGGRVPGGARSGGLRDLSGGWRTVRLRLRRSLETRTGVHPPGGLA